MNVASLEFCKELYKASDWEGCHFWWSYNDAYVEGKRWRLNGGELFDGDIPAYDLGYLLRKLPPVIQDPDDKIFKHIQLWINGDGTAHIGYVEPYAHDDKVAYAQKSDVLEDTAAKLAIELFKQGILTK